MPTVGAEATAPRAHQFPPKLDVTVSGPEPALHVSLGLHAGQEGEYGPRRVPADRVTCLFPDATVRKQR